MVLKSGQVQLSILFGVGGDCGETGRRVLDEQRLEFAYDEAGFGLGQLEL